MESSGISLEQARHVARLSRLALSDEQLQRFAGQLSSILHYVDQLGQVDTASVEPMAHPLPLTNVLRDDVEEPGLDLESVLRNAPEADGRFFKVPKIIDSGEDSAG